MSKKAPDTRNKLEKISVSKKKITPKSKILDQQGLKKLAQLANLKQEEVNYPIEKKLSKGQLFKAKFGFSKTMKRNLNKHGLLDESQYSNNLALLTYRDIRKKRKISEKKMRQEKHKASVTFKRLNGKKKGAKNQSQTKKKETSSK